MLCVENSRDCILRRGARNRAWSTELNCMATLEPITSTKSIQGTDSVEPRRTCVSVVKQSIII
jgi:hypothetical protein